MGIGFGLLAALIWGGYIAVTHLGVASGLTAWDLAFLRYGIAGLLLAPWLLRNRPLSLAGVGWRKGAIMVLLVGPPFVLVGASGFAFAPLAHGAVIQLGMVTLSGIVFAALLAREHPSRRRIVGLVGILAGLAITSGPSLLSGAPGVWRGDLLFALAGAMWGLFTVLQRRWRVDAFSATAIVSVVSGLIYSPIYIASGRWRALFDVDPGILLMQAVMLGVLSGVVALFAFGRAVEVLGPARASVFPALAPAVAILAGIPLSGDWPTMMQIGGLVVLSIGLLIAVQGPRIHAHLACDELR